MNDESLRRFWRNVDKRGPDECWNWLASKKPFGYGQLMINGKMKRAHRVSWELYTGEPIPISQNICHKCDNASCVNPAHLFMGTQKDNIQDAQKKGRLYNHWRIKTHCPKGHPYDEINTRIVGVKRGKPGRECKACRRIAKKKSKHPSAGTT